MINLLENGIVNTTEVSLEEEELISLIYRFASKKDEWFNLLLSLSNCISLTEGLNESHPYKDLATRIMAHLKNAIKISSQLNTCSRHEQAQSVLDHIPMGAAIINETGRIIELNQEAKTFFESSPDWQMEQGYLSATHLRLNIELMPLADPEYLSVIGLPLESMQHPPSTSSKKKTNNGIQLLHITALPTGQKDTCINQHYYLCFKSHHNEAINAELLKSRYQLTDTEALVVVTLFSEISSRKTASKLKLKEATIRGHLSSIYEKAGVKRKPELIRKIMLHSLFSTNTRHDIGLVTSTPQALRLKLPFIYLRDGRRLSYLDHRPDTGKASKPSSAEDKTVVILHNMMGSAKELPHSAHPLINTHNVRIIVPERPGYGDSDPHPKRTHKTWAHDLKELLDSLNIDKVMLIAHSIGGVYALALTEFLPDRIERVAMVNAMPRISDITVNKEVPSLVTAVIRSLRYAPFLIEPILKMAVGKDIEHFYEQQLNYIRPSQEGRAADINLLKTPAYKQYAIANLKQSAKQGVAIWANELKLSFAELPFSLSQCQIPFQFWHGEHDDVIPIEAAQNLAKDLNTQSFTRMHCETHFLFARHFNEVLEQLLLVPSETSTH